MEMGTSSLIEMLWEQLGESPDRWLGAMFLTKQLVMIVETSTLLSLDSETTLGVLGQYLDEATNNPICERIIDEYATAHGR